MTRGAPSFGSLLGCVGFAALLLFSGPLPAAAASQVYFAHDQDALDQYHQNTAAIRRMVDALVCRVAGQPDAARAWASLVKPNERVGIKISAAGGRYFSTHKALVDAIVEGLVEAGHPRDHIFVWSRDEAGLVAAGYRAGGVPYSVRSIEPGVGYDRAAVFSAPVLGRLIWGDLLFARQNSDEDQLSSQSHFSRILVHDVDRIINVPVFSDAPCGVAGCLYNVTIPNIDNWRRILQPPAFGDPALCELYADPRIGPKVVIHIMDALLAQYAGGPAPEPNYSFDLGTIYASKDPVAIDATALRRIDQWRKEASLPPVSNRAGYLQTAARGGLGRFAPEDIDLKEVAAP